MNTLTQAYKYWLIYWVFVTIINFVIEHLRRVCGARTENPIRAAHASALILIETLATSGWPAAPLGNPNLNPNPNSTPNPNPKP